MVRTQKSLQSNVSTLTTTTPKKKTTTTTKFKYSNSRKEKLFPHKTFKWRLEDRKENKTCWFSCEDHVQTYIDRYKLKAIKDYICLYHSQ